MSSVERAYGNSDVKRVLDELFRLTQVPVLDLETSQAVDGTGMPTSSKVNYENDKRKGKMAGFEHVLTAIGTTYKLYSSVITMENPTDNESPYFPLAVQDMIRIIGRRFPIARMILVPVLVQGAEAAEDIAAGIQEMNRLREPRPDVMIVGRGGGSIEDLWAFNEEVVARAMFASDIPVISAVGHETDFTIADFVADMRAATPSEAAEKVVPDKEALLGQIDGTQEALSKMMTDAIQGLEQGLDDEALQLEGAMGELLVSGSRDIDHAAEMLESLGPRKVLRRGYAIVTREGETVSSVAVLHPKDNVEITVTDGKAGAEIQKVKRVRTV